jgi:hypothetical protein
MENSSQASVKPGNKPFIMHHKSYIYNDVMNVINDAIENYANMHKAMKNVELEPADAKNIYAQTYKGLKKILISHITIVIIQDPKNLKRYVVSYAACSATNNFSRKEGIELALKRCHVPAGKVYSFGTFYREIITEKEPLNYKELNEIAKVCANEIEQMLYTAKFQLFSNKINKTAETFEKEQGIINLISNGFENLLEERVNNDLKQNNNVDMIQDVEFQETSVESKKDQNAE